MYNMKKHVHSIKKRKNPVLYILNITSECRSGSYFGGLSLAGASRPSRGTSKLEMEGSS